MIGVVRRYPVLAGFVMMFLFTWPIDLWAAAASHGRAVAPPPILPLLVVGGRMWSNSSGAARVLARPGLTRRSHVEG